MCGLRHCIDPPLVGFLPTDFRMLSIGKLLYLVGNLLRMQVWIIRGRTRLRIARPFIQSLSLCSLAHIDTRERRLEDETI